MKEFIITSDQMKMLAESVGYFVDEPISEVVIRGEKLPDAGELRAENAKLRELLQDMYIDLIWEYPEYMMEDYKNRLCELGIEVR